MRMKPAFYLVVICAWVLVGWLWVLWIPDFAVMFLVKEAEPDLFRLTYHIIIDLPEKLFAMIVSWVFAYGLVLDCTEDELKDAQKGIQ